MATTVAPSLVFWAVVFYLLGADPDELLLFAIFAALPIPLFFLVYRRYRKGLSRDEWLRKRSPRQLLWGAVTWATLGTGWVALGVHSWPRDQYDSAARILYAVVAYGMATEALVARRKKVALG